METPKNYDFSEAEPRIRTFWDEEGINTFDPDSPKEIFSIDTPPPTVSGKMHMGHAFGYSQMDIVARYKRMKGFNVFYPFGTDDNGLATNTLVEKENKVKASKMDRKEFVQLAISTLDKVRPQYVADWKRIGLAADFNIFYSTINDHSRAISQRSFIELYKKGREYRKEAPMTICPKCQTAIAQVEMEDMDREGEIHTLRVTTETGEELQFATTRPELLPACVGMSVHPDDKRFAHLVGKKARIPLIDRDVTISHDPEVNPEFGTGVIYVCTYGGLQDVEWLTRHPGVEPLHIMDIEGVFNEKAGKYAGMRSLEARKAILEDLKEVGALVETKKLKQTVNVHERCGTEIEYVATKQWFIKYLDLKDDMLSWGNDLNWTPPHMKNRFDNWVKGLKWDWCISRQRVFGVPFPVWYSKKTGEPILADIDQLPVDPLVDVPFKLPEGHTLEDIEPEKDMLDTWATSSLTPQLAAELFKDHSVYHKLLPMDLRPQGHDIIAFWLFNTVVKSQLHDDRNPWKDVNINGWALDPKGRKMSKSKGNVVEPQAVMEKYPADALRFWAAGSRLGDDMPYQEKDLVTGKKTVTKLWNASKFAAMHLEDFDLEADVELTLFDKGVLSKLQGLIRESTEHMDAYNYARAKLEVDTFFWQMLCDNYLEIAKDRLYNPDKRGDMERKSAQYTLYQLLSSLVKMFAPVMPFITEEVYQHFLKKFSDSKSVHHESWPSVNDTLVDCDAEMAVEVALYALEQTRKAKSEQSMSLKSPIKKLNIAAKISPEEFEELKADIAGSTHAEEITYSQIDPEGEQKVVCDVVL